MVRKPFMKVKRRTSLPCYGEDSNACNPIQISLWPQVKTPVMIVIGKEDHRAPPKQGEEYYKAVKSRGIDTK